MKNSELNKPTQPIEQKKSINYYMRSLHRDLGFIAVGFIVVYALSGIVMVYRDTDFLKQEKTVVKNLAMNLESKDLGKALSMREFKVKSAEGDSIIFEGGAYTKLTGVAVYQVKEIIFPFNKFIQLHKAVSKDSIHWFNITFAIVLLYMSISAFWMFKLHSDSFRRGILFSIGGIVLTLILLSL